MIFYICQSNVAITRFFLHVFFSLHIKYLWDNKNKTDEHHEKWNYMFILNWLNWIKIMLTKQKGNSVAKLIKIYATSVYLWYKQATHCKATLKLKTQMNHMKCNRHLINSWATLCVVILKLRFSWNLTSIAVHKVNIALQLESWIHSTEM